MTFYRMRILTFGLSGVTRGGIESFMLTFSKHMKEECTFDYVLLERNTIQEYKTINPDTHVYEISPYWKHPLRYILDIIHLVREHRNVTDAVYCHLFNTLHILPVLLCRWMGLKVIVHAHNNNIPQRNLVYRAACRAGKRALQRCHCLWLSNSDDSTEYLFGKEKIPVTQIIHNAINIENFRFSPTARTHIRQEIGAEGHIVVGFVGRLMEQKNPIFAVEVFGQFHLLCPKSIMLMVGEGYMQAQVEERIHKNGLAGSIILTGVRQDISTLYQAMDVLLMPSLFEGLGIVLVEAQATGLPCLTSANNVPDIVNLTDLIQREDLKATPQQWANHLLDMATNLPQHRTRYADEVAKTSFNITTEAKRLTHIIRNYLYEPIDRP